MQKASAAQTAEAFYNNKNFCPNKSASYNLRGSQEYSLHIRYYLEFGKGQDTIMEHTSCGTDCGEYGVLQKTENAAAYILKNALLP